MPDSKYDFDDGGDGSADSPQSESDGGIGDHAAETWRHTKTRADELFVHTRQYLRENPGAALLAAVGFGFLLGLAIRATDEPEEKAESMSSRISSRVPEMDDLKALVIPFFWPIVKFFTRSYEASTEYAGDLYEKGRDINVKKYVKPIVKKVKRAF